MDASTHLLWLTISFFNGEVGDWCWVAESVSLMWILLLTTVRCQTATDDYSSIIVTYLTEQKSYLQHETGRGAWQRSSQSNFISTSPAFALLRLQKSQTSPRICKEKERSCSRARTRGGKTFTAEWDQRGCTWKSAVISHCAGTPRRTPSIKKRETNFHRLKVIYQVLLKQAGKHHLSQHIYRQKQLKTQQALIHQETLVQQLLWNLVQPKTFDMIFRERQTCKVLGRSTRGWVWLFARGRQGVFRGAQTNNYSESENSRWKLLLISNGYTPRYF